MADKENVACLISCRIFQDMAMFIDKMKQIRSTFDNFKIPPTDSKFSVRFLRSNRQADNLRHAVHYHTIGLLGRGSYGNVYLVQSKKNGMIFALKTVHAKKEQLTETIQRSIMIERDAALVVSDSDYFVKLKAIWMEVNDPIKPDCYQLLWEVMKYGDMTELISQFHPFIEDDADYAFCNMQEYLPMPPLDLPFVDQEVYQAMCEVKAIRKCGKTLKFRRIYWQYFKQMIEAVTHLHSKGLVHRDIKPENIMVTEALNLKLGDYGLVDPFDYKHLFPFNIWNDAPIVDNEVSETLSASPVTLKNVAKDYWNREMKIVQPPGTVYYQPPEYFEEWYNKGSKAISIYKHKAGDWFALGSVMFTLVSGLFCHQKAVHLVEGKPEMNVEVEVFKESRMKLKPEKNPLLHPRGRNPNIMLNRLYIDRKFINIAAKMMLTNPKERLGITCFESCRDYRELEEEFRDVDIKSQIWGFNEFLASPRQSLVDKLLAEDKNTGSDFDEATKLVLPEAGTTRTQPPLANLSFVNLSPPVNTLLSGAIIASPPKRPRQPRET